MSTYVTRLFNRKVVVARKMVENYFIDGKKISNLDLTETTANKPFCTIELEEEPGKRYLVQYHNVEMKIPRGNKK